MNKRDLRKLEQLKATDLMIHEVYKDKGEEVVRYCSRYDKRNAERHTKYRFYKYMLAEVENDILKVGIWTRKQLALGYKHPEFTIFMDKSDGTWITLETDESKWLEAMIYKLPYRAQEGEEWGSSFWIDAGSEKIVQEYLNREMTAYSAIKEYQLEQRKEQLKLRNKSELEAIDEFMDSVPDYPTEYNNEWLIREAFVDKAVIIYRTGKTCKEGYCTICDEWVPVNEKPLHMKHGVCEKCKTKIVYKSWGRQKALFERKNVGIIQKTRNKGEYCLTVEDVCIERKREEDYKQVHIGKYNTYRFRLNENFHVRDEFEWYEYKNTGVVRWCKAKRHGMGWNARYATTFCTLYSGNLGIVKENAGLRNMPVEELVKKMNGMQFHVNDLLDSLIKNPGIEKMIKAGLCKLAIESATKYNPQDEIRMNCSKLKDMLKLDKTRMKQAIEIDANSTELKVLQSTEMLKIYLSNEQIKQIAEFVKYQGIAEIMLILNRGKIQKTFDYLEELSKGTRINKWEIIRDYEDYLGQLRRLQIPVDKHTRFPVNFQAEHSALSARIREMQEQWRQQDIAVKNKKLNEMIADLKELYDVETKELMIVWPTSKDDFVKEGQIQHNCVGTNNYFDRMCQGQTVVFFLRKKSEPETPYCTVEFQRGIKIQCRIKYNAEAPKDAISFCKLVEKKYRIKMNEKEGEVKAC